MAIRRCTPAPSRCSGILRWRGPTGVGKSFVASALAQKACRDGYSALYMGAAALFRDLAIARADGSLRLLLARFSRLDVLVIDDWAMSPLSETERRDFWEICEDRYQTRSLILTSQLPVTRWHDQIGDPTVADGILDPWFTTHTASKCAEIPCANPGTLNHPTITSELLCSAVFPTHCSHLGLSHGRIASRFNRAFSGLVILNGNDTAHTPQRSRSSGHTSANCWSLLTSQTSPARLCQELPRRHLLPSIRLLQNP